MFYIKKVFVVWEDYRDIARGSDLYIASSPNMITFSPGKNISTFPGNVNEIAPSMVWYNDQLGIAYLAIGSLLLTQNVRLKLLDAVSMDGSDYRLKSESASLIHTQPSVYTASYGRFLVAYGSYDVTSHDLNAVVAEVETENTISWWYDSVLYKTYVGNVTMPEVNIYPGIAGRSVLRDHASECIVAFTTFKNGMNDSADPFHMYLGDIEVAQLFSEEVLTYP